MMLGLLPRTESRAHPGTRCARVLSLLAFILLSFALNPTDVPAQAPQTITGQIVDVVDGDTIDMRIGDRIEKVRYIGVNAPELHHPTLAEQPGGREAAEVNRRLVQGQTVRLELDVQERDKYGCLLAYVYVGDRMVNAELVAEGYAQVMTIPPNVKYQELFVRLQRSAREGSRGLWTSHPFQRCTSGVVGVRTTMSYF